MRTVRLNMIVAFVALTTSGVYADLSPASTVSSACSVQGHDAPALADAAKTVIGPKENRAGGDERGADWGVSLWSTDVDVDGLVRRQAAPEMPDHSQAATGPVLREIRPEPSSLSLFLSVVLSVGGWHCFRSTRNLHFGALPEWYHTGGPAQVGHATPLDLDFNSPPLCCFEQATGERSLVHLVRREIPPRCDEQACPMLAAPRGPPPLS